MDKPTEPDIKITPRVINRKCTNCENCVKVCPTDSIFYGVKHFVIDTETCHGCGVCEAVCPFEAITKLALIQPQDNKTSK